MTHRIVPTGGLSPLIKNRRTPWKTIVAALLLVSLVGLLLWWNDTSEPTRGKTTALNSMNDSATLDTSRPITEVKVQLEWGAKVDLDLAAFYTTKNGITGQVDYRIKDAPGIRLDTDAGVDEKGGRNEENITITALDWYKEIWFATFLFSSMGTYSDYDGRVTLTTNNGDDIQVPLTSTENKRYLLIAKLTNGPDGPTFSTLNKAVECEELDPILGTNAGCRPIEPKTGG